MEHTLEKELADAKKARDDAMKKWEAKRAEYEEAVKSNSPMAPVYKETADKLEADKIAMEEDYKTLLKTIKDVGTTSQQTASRGMLVAILSC
jgi:hypothetical protein